MLIFVGSFSFYLLFCRFASKLHAKIQGERERERVVSKRKLASLRCPRGEFTTVSVRPAKPSAVTLCQY